MPTTIKTEQQALADILKSQEEGGAVSASGPLGTGADVPKVLAENPAYRQLVEESIRTNTGQSPNKKTVTDTPTDGSQTDTTVSDKDTIIERPIIDTTGGGVTNGFADELSSLKPPSAQEIRQGQLARAQSLIDATNSLFQADIADLTAQGESALAQTSSIAVGAGLAGSPFQLTAETQTQGRTNKVIQARRAERAAEIAAVMAAAQDKATDQFETAMAGFRQEREFLTSERDKANLEASARADAAETKAFNSLTALAEGGFSLDELSKEEYGRLLSDAGISDFEAKARWAAASPEANATYTSQNGFLVGTYIDPSTGKPVITTTPLPEELQGAEGVDVQTLTDANGNVYWYDGNDATNPDGSLKSFGVGEKATEDDGDILSISELGEINDQYGTDFTFGTTEQDVINSGITPTTKDTQPVLSTKDIADTDQATKLSGIGKLNDAIANYRALLEDGGLASTGRAKQKALLDNAFQQITFAVKDAEDLGALQAPDIELIKGLLPDPKLGLISTIADSFLGSASPIATAKLERVLDSITQTTDAYAGNARNYIDQLRALGASPDDPFFQELITQAGLDPSEFSDDDIDLFLDNAESDFPNDLGTSINGSDISKTLGSFRANVVGDIKPSSNLVTMNLGNKTIQANESVASRLQAADADYFKATGQHLPISQDFRTPEKQQELMRTVKGRVAPQGYSFHEIGMAFDVHADWKRAQPFLNKYGFRNDLPDDRGHFSVGETA